MSAHDIERCVNLDDDARSLLTACAKKFELSGRAFHRIIKVAQTISDLAANHSIKKDHWIRNGHTGNRPSFDCWYLPVSSFC
jgi:magnesium chelatase family protein